MKGYNSVTAKALILASFYTSICNENDPIEKEIKKIFPKSTHEWHKIQLSRAERKGKSHVEIAELRRKKWEELNTNKEANHEN